MPAPHSLADEAARRVTPMLQEPDQRAIVTRLNRAEGQIRGIRRMVQEPRMCVEILQQLAAVEAALHRVSQVVFRSHVDACVGDGLTNGNAERKKEIGELVDILDRYGR